MPIADYTERVGRPAAVESSIPAVPASCASPAVEVETFDRLSSVDKVRWESIRQETDRFREPFFSVAFADAVHQARGDVEVAIVRRAGLPIAYLPFHRIGRHGFPVGRFLNDAHNLIGAHHVESDWQWLLKSLGLRSFEFHALVGCDANAFPPHTCHDTVRSFRCEIGDKPAHYFQQLKRSHKTIGKQGQKTRKMAREVGEIRFELDCRSRHLLDQTICWKRDQYHRTHILDLFSPPWTRRLMDALFVPAPGLAGPSDSRQARGLLSVLRAGDHVVAAHYGILENGSLHYWFPAYDPAFSRYSPGTALFCQILEHAGQLGIRCLDMGYGEQPYKLKQTDATGFVIQGCMADSGFYRHWRCAQVKAFRAIKHTPAKESIKRVWRRLRPSAGISKLG